MPQTTSRGLKAAEKTESEASEYREQVAFERHIDRLFLREGVAEGDIDGVPYEAAHDLGNGGVLVQFKDTGTFYRLSLEEIVQAAYRARTQHNGGAT